MSEEKKKMTGLKLRGDIWHINKVVNGKRIRMSTGAKNREQAEGILVEMVARDCRAEMMTAWNRHVNSMSTDYKSWLWRTIQSCETRSRRKNYSACMTIGQLSELMHNSEGRCQVTGIEFDYGAGAKGSPYRYSVDRIDSNIGYSIGNCRIVCLCVNYALNKWGVDVLDRMSKGFLLKSLEKNTPDSLSVHHPIEMVRHVPVRGRRKNWRDRKGTMTGTQKPSQKEGKT